MPAHNCPPEPASPQACRRFYQAANYNQANCAVLLQLACQLQASVLAGPQEARASGLVNHLVPALESLAHFISVFSVWCGPPADCSADCAASSRATGRHGMEGTCCGNLAGVRPTRCVGPHRGVPSPHAVPLGGLVETYKAVMQCAGPARTHLICCASCWLRRCPTCTNDNALRASKLLCVLEWSACVLASSTAGQSRCLVFQQLSLQCLPSTSPAAVHSRCRAGLTLLRRLPKHQAAAVHGSLCVTALMALQNKGPPAMSPSACAPACSCVSWLPACRGWLAHL